MEPLKALEWLSAELGVYGNYIDDYIYLAPELREDGTIRTDVLITGRYPRLAMRPSMRTTGST